MFQSSIYTTEGATVQPNASNFICEAINKGYNAGLDNFYCTDSIRHPFYTKTRPVKNNFDVILLASNSNNDFVSSSLGVAIELTLIFTRYDIPLYSYIHSYKNTEKPTPFNVILNSKNGEMVVTSVNQITYNYNWQNHHSINPSQKYEMSMLFIMMGQNMSSYQPMEIRSDFFDTGGNYVVSSNGYKNSDKLFTSCSPSSFTNLVNVIGSTRVNLPITTTIPHRNIFTVRLYEMGTDTLFTRLNDYIIQLHFKPINL